MARSHVRAVLLTPICSIGDLAVLLGVTYSFGCNFGFTVNDLFCGKPNERVATAGVDLSGGYAFDSTAILVGEDFLEKDFTVSVS